MIQTEIKQLGDNEHEVEVRLPKAEYERIHAAEVQKLMGQVKLPGFRQGKTPNHVIQKQFGPKIHEDTVSALLQQHYVGAIESSGLTPALQPELSLPPVQPDDAFVFLLKVATWPEVKLNKVSKLKFEQTEVTVGDDDVQSVLERLYKSQVSYEVISDRAAEKGDQLHVDFEGFIADEAFEGGKGENVALVLGEGRFIPGFEEQLMGKKADESCVVEVSFPEDYQAANLAGKAARFETTVKSVGEAKKASNDEELAKLLNFDDVAALMADVRQGLDKEAVKAAQTGTRDAALNALLEANPMRLAASLVAEDVKSTTARVVQNMKQQGMEATSEMFADEAFKTEVRERSERGLKLSVLIQALREEAGLELADEDVDVAVDAMVAEYPENMRDDYAKYIRDNQEQLGAIKDRLLEQKCIDYLAEQAKVSTVSKTLSQWQAEQDKVTA
ncbi:MAG: trigger factor [Mariprofundaceae bacterium]|nr:trigger factor [Mariprofundaceae bacterium]